MTRRKEPENLQRCGKCAFWDLDGWGFSRPCSVWHGQYKQADSICESFQRDARYGGPTDSELRAFMDAAVGERR
jgi:hypothetical protein